MCHREAVYLRQRQRVREGFSLRTADTSDLLFLTGQAHGASTHHTPQAMTTQQRPPHPGPGPVTSGPKDLGRFLSPVQNAPVVPI